MALYCLQYYSELQFYNSIFKLRINNKTATAYTKLNFQQKLLSYKFISCRLTKMTDFLRIFFHPNSPFFIVIESF